MFSKVFVSEIQQPGFDDFVKAVHIGLQVGQTRTLVLASSGVTESNNGLCCTV